MAERNQLLRSIAETIKDYRVGEIPQPTTSHVDRWVRQFDEGVQLPMLRELDHVLKQTYFSQRHVAGFLSNLVKNDKLAGSNPCVYWRGVNFLRIQQNGHSQVELLTIFDSALEAVCGFSTRSCGSAGGHYVYLDDAMFSGGRIGNDLAAWIENDAPGQAVIHVIVIAIHTSGEWLAGERLRKSIAMAGKNITIHYWRATTIENRKSYKADSGVLWPAELPDNAGLQAYLAVPQKFPFELRSVGGKLGPFSSEAGRQLLEREFTLAGVKIRNFCNTAKPIMRPLGFSPFGLGFGSTIVTFRNCPNNCPLALWWGDQNADPGHPFSNWYPLLPRKTYDQGFGFDAFGF
jgi:hypothetical protein